MLYNSWTEEGTNTFNLTGDVSFYIDNIYLQEVDMDYCLGWDVHNRIAYCHAGYYTNGPKSALIQNTNEKYFCLLDEKNNEVYKDCGNDKRGYKI